MMIKMRPLHVFGWFVAALLMVRGVVMLADPAWWLGLISNEHAPNEALINRTLFLSANELIVGGFIVLSLTTNLSMQSALWMAALLSIGHVSVDISRHLLDVSTRDATSFVYIQNHIIHPLIVLYAVLFSWRANARESRYLNSEFNY